MDKEEQRSKDGPKTSGTMKGGKISLTGKNPEKTINIEVVIAFSTPMSA